MDVNIGDILDDLEADMRAPDASGLSAKQLVEELQARGLKPTGFPEDDIKLLQKHLNAEFEAEKAEKIKERREALLKRKAEEDAMRMQRFLEKQKREEEEALAADERMSFFVSLLRTNSTASDMCIRAAPTAIRAFLKAISETGNTSLRGLDLCGCQLGDDVGIEVGNCLKLNKTLQRIELDHNKLGPKSLVALAAGLQSNSTLVSLSLEHNPFAGEDPALPDHAGFAALAEALKTNRGLLSLNLFQVGLGGPGGKLLREGVESNPSLRAVQLSGADGVEASDLSAITDRLRANGAEHAAGEAAAKTQRAAARRLAAEKEAADEAKAAEDAEVAWVESERSGRQLAREAADFEAYRKERMAQMQREVDERARKARLAAEAEEKAKKAKKK